MGRTWGKWSALDSWDRTKEQMEPRAEENHRVEEGFKVMSMFRSTWKERSVLLRAKTGMFEGIIVLAKLYGCKS